MKPELLKRLETFMKPSSKSSSENWDIQSRDLIAKRKDHGPISLFLVLVVRKYFAKSKQSFRQGIGVIGAHISTAIKI